MIVPLVIGVLLVGIGVVGFDHADRVAHFSLLSHHPTRADVDRALLNAAAVRIVSLLVAAAGVALLLGGVILA